MTNGYLPIKGLMERYGIGRKKALEIAYTVGTAPRHKNQKIYVSTEKADAYMEGEYDE